MIVLDTDHCIFFIRGDKRAVAAFENHADDEPAISIITVGELYFGASRSLRKTENLARCREFISRVSVLPLDDPIMLRFAETKANLFARGETIQDFDLLIAATALTYDAVLATHNQAHFTRIPNLRIDDWCK
jgi:tRNA(fMet)-specific endonuclease VapC